MSGGLRPSAPASWPQPRGATRSRRTARAQAARAQASSGPDDRRFGPLGAGMRWPRRVFGWHAPTSGVQPPSGHGVRAPPSGTEGAHGPNILRSAARCPARVYPGTGRSTGRRLDVEGEAAGRWLDVNSAAGELGVSTDAVRKRISRGSLRSDRKDGTVRVWLNDGGTEAGREAHVDGGALVEVLREQAEYLRKQLHEEREARRRADTIIAQLARANEEQARTIRELEAPREEASEAAETVEEPDRAEPGSEPRSAAVEAQD